MILSISKPPRELAWLYTVRLVAFLVPLVFLPLMVVMSLVFRSEMIPDRLPELLDSFLISALAAGLGVGFVVRIGYRNLFDVNYAGQSSIDQTVRVIVELPYHAAFEKCLAALPALGSCHILMADRSRGIIEVVRIPKPFWKSVFGSYGGRISIRLGSDTEGVTVAQIKSRAPLSAAIFGTKQHERNVSSISDFLQESTG